MVADPEGLYAPQPAEAPIGRIVEIAYNGIKRAVRVDANGRVVAESPVSDDGWSRRGTFTGDAEAFLAAKRAGVGLKPDPEEPPPAPPFPPPPMIWAEPQPEPPAPGLLADIAGGLAGQNQTDDMLCQRSARGGLPTFAKPRGERPGCAVERNRPFAAGPGNWRDRREAVVCRR